MRSEKNCAKNYSYDDDLRFPYDVKIFKNVIFLFCNIKKTFNFGSKMFFIQSIIIFK